MSRQGIFFNFKEKEYIVEDSNSNFNLKDYRFDVNYFEEIKNYDLDEGGMVRFKLVANYLPDS